VGERKPGWPVKNVGADKGDEERRLEEEEHGAPAVSRRLFHCHVAGDQTDEEDRHREKVRQGFCPDSLT
jgi:hypothetical protein